jgi:hypothetical protein
MGAGRSRLVTVLAELDTRTQRKILNAVAAGTQLPAAANQLGVDIRTVRAIASDAGFPDLDAVRVALARLTRPPKPRPAPPDEREAEEADHPAVALAVTFHGTHPSERPAYLARIGDRARLEQVTVFLAAMLPATFDLHGLDYGLQTMRFAVRSRDPRRIRHALDAHDPLSLCDLARDLADALPADLDPADALAWSDPDD